MQEKNPFEVLFDEFTKLLNFVKANIDKPFSEVKAPEKTEKKLKKLTQAVDSFNRLSDLIVSLSGVSKEELQLRLSGASKDMPPAAKRLMDQGNAVKKDAQTLKEKIEEMAKLVPLAEQMIASGPPAVETRNLTDKEKSKKRRSKFKRFGGDEKWKPL
ncbi:MAG: hypothetical protein WCG42_00390 [Parachlamydiaceae bacterium]